MTYWYFNWIILRKSGICVIYAKLPLPISILKSAICVYSEPTGDISLCTSGLWGFYISGCCSILYLTGSFLLSLQLVVRLPLVIRILIFEIPQHTTMVKEWWIWLLLLWLNRMNSTGCFSQYTEYMCVPWALLNYHPQLHN